MNRSQHLQVFRSQNLTDAEKMWITTPMVGSLHAEAIRIGLVSALGTIGGAGALVMERRKKLEHRSAHLPCVLFIPKWSNSRGWGCDKVEQGARWLSKGMMTQGAMPPCPRCPQILLRLCAFQLHQEMLHPWDSESPRGPTACWEAYRGVRINPFRTLKPPDLSPPHWMQNAC